MNYQREPFVDVMGEIKALWDLHYAEIAHYQDIALEPDYEFYSTNPALRVFTARDEGRLVGYAIFGISHNKHYMSSLQAVQDLLYVHPEWRGKGLGQGLIEFSDKQLADEGCQVVYHHVKAAHAQVFAPLLERNGYQLVDNIYARRLDHGRNV
jgi:GNAT superfamily N-acetyltransferase